MPRRHAKIVAGAGLGAFVLTVTAAAVAPETQEWTRLGLGAVLWAAAGSCAGVVWGYVLFRDPEVPPRPVLRVLEGGRRG